MAPEPPAARRRSPAVKKSGVLLLTLLSTCNLAPDYRPPAPPTLPATFKETGPWTPAQPADPSARADWWTIMADARLNDLESRIEHGSPQLAAAVARYDQARALVRRARAEFFPQIDASSSAERERAVLVQTGNSFDYRTYAAGGTIAWEPDIWGRIRNLVAAARSEAQASADDLAGMRLSLEAELGEDYFQLRGLDARIDVLRRTVTAYQAALDLTTKRFTGGSASELDVGRARTQLASTQSELDQQVANRALTEHAIAVLIGEDPSLFSLPPAGTLDPVPPVPVTAPSTLLQRRPDVAAAERHMAAANARIGIARAAFFPTITLGASGGSSTTTGMLLAAGTGVWALGPALATLAVFDGGRRFADLAAMHAAYAEMAANYRQTALTAFREVEDQLALLNHLADASARQQEAVSAAARTNQLATIQYREGAVDYLQVVIAQTAELQAREDMIAIATRRLAAAIDLVRALGGGWQATGRPA
ncbi:efflux transporter outer membrane subunit [Gluconacetobacter takamatsuzukensis]|uniref:Efflux transporter outer membrane subunit n=1 Tax=Gluconacetobacter takamatsuzukensis TaxID=1286190 RepID=A0A7W4PS51_9PROT|nr:efflux transporter outer membrane subunit [Gluconacetobacter takamatsuzukensis]MBB2206034.1 efflux transporter outer membrane subunit [Gluconacetobacter takamatsuzukensis]